MNVSAKEGAQISVLSLIEDAYYEKISGFDALKRKLSIPSEGALDGIEPICIKALIIMLYSGYEGFIKYASIQYVDYMNKLELNTGDVQYQFAAASLHKEFKDIEQGSAKSELFSSTLPDDSNIRRLCRRSELVRHLHLIWSMKVEISDKDYVDTESNLKYRILCRTLYAIGLDPLCMAKYQGAIEKLCRFRNPFAHGIEILDTTYIREYPDIEAETRKVMKLFKDILTRAIIQEGYLLSNEQHA